MNGVGGGSLEIVRVGELCAYTTRPPSMCKELQYLQMHVQALAMLQQMHTAQHLTGDSFY